MGKLENCNIVIVNYCTPDLVLKCADSLLRTNLCKATQIIVVDNASPDDSIGMFKALPKEVRVICSDENLGFGHGVNVGIKHCVSDFVLILNPDTYVEDNSVVKALNVLCNNSAIAVAGLDLIFPGGLRQYSSRRFYSILDIVSRRTRFGNYWPLRGKIKEHLLVDRWDDEDPFDAEWVTGAGFLVRRSVFIDIGGMDEGYFLYMEDVDYCARVWLAGHRVVCVPNARLVHDHQKASAAGPFSRAGKIHLRSLMRFRSKFGLPFFCRPGISGLQRGQTPAALLGSLGVLS